MADETTQANDQLDLENMTVEEKVEHSEDEAHEEHVEEQAAAAPVAEEEEDEKIDQEEKLPFPTAAVVRLMKAYMDPDKMIKKDVKVAMNKWLGSMCARVAREMNKFPYVMMHRHEFEHAKRQFEDLENFEHEKQRILAHLEAMKQDIKRLERDLGKKEEEHEIRLDKSD